MEERLRILLCEDDENLGMLLREYLQAKGYAADLFSDGESGYKAFLKGKYDLCVLDVMMPKKDGFTLAQEIRTVNGEVPIIFLTAKSLKEDILEGFKIGADDYITKPFSSTYLKTRILSLLRQRKQLQDLYLSKLSEHTQEEDHINGWEPSQPQVTPYDEQFMQQVMAFMEEQMDNTDITIDDFANKLMLSRTVFYRKLKSIVGLTPVDFVCEMRIKRAAQLIEKSEYSFSQIAYMTGFNDPKYFSKCFKKVVGITPSEYKEKNK